VAGAEIQGEAEVQGGAEVQSEAEVQGEAEVQIDAEVQSEATKGSRVTVTTSNRIDGRMQVVFMIRGCNRRGWREAALF